MFNLSTKRSQQTVTTEEALRAQNKADDLNNDGMKVADKMLEEVRDNTDLIDTTEVQLAGTGRESGDQKLVEGKLNEATSKTVVHRNNDNEYNTVSPLGRLNQAQEEEKKAAYKKAEDTKGGDTEYWDSYVSKVLPDKMVGKTGPSQLQNNPDRFSNLSTDVRELNKGSVKDMVTASLKDADAMLLNIYFKAAAEKRFLYPDEQTLVNSLNEDKVKILTAAADANALSANIEALQQQLHNTPITSPDHDRVQHELDKMIQLGRGMVGQQEPVSPFSR